MDLERELFEGHGIGMSWAMEEFAGIDWGDKRLDQRAVWRAERLAEKPLASLPGACNGWAETPAAYRFFGQEALDWRELLAPHTGCTLARMPPQRVVWCLQDTTELDFNGQMIDGLGPLSYEAQRGMYRHPTDAVSPEREPLGVLDAWLWAREPKDPAGKRGGLLESRRWLEGYERVAAWAADLPDTRLVYVADREADILALMRRARDLGNPADWLIRSQHHRALPEGEKLWATVTAGESLGEIRFTRPSREGRQAWTVRQQIWVQSVVLGQCAHTGVTATCLVAKEVGAPLGVEPIEWRLLTNREATTLEQAVELIDWYRARWEIELLFHVFKNGCRVAALQLSTLDRIERALTLYLVVAWRIARLMRLGRTCPDVEAALLFAREEWEAADILNKKQPPSQAPRLNEVIRLIAQLGGFLGRKSDGEPGVKTIWQGLQRVMDFVLGLRFARELQAE